MIRTVILDLDGPVLDGRLRHHACYRTILEAHGRTPLPIEDYWAMKRARAGLEEQLAASGAGDLREEFSRAWLERIESPELLALDRLQPGAGPKLRGWRERGTRLILATMRRSPENLRAQLLALGILPLFERVVACEHRAGGAGKAQRVREAVENLRVQEALWVGDTEADVEAARALGCRIWAVSCGLRASSCLAALSPDYLSPDLRSVNPERCAPSDARDPAQISLGGAR